jgi:hypothetical protein
MSVEPEIVVECRSADHPKGRVQKIDTFTRVADEWSGEVSWRGRYQRYSIHSPATIREQSLRVRFPDGHVRVRLQCPEREFHRHVVRQEHEFMRALDTLAADGRKSADLTEFL